jgi:hypothetical protein
MGRALIVIKDSARRARARAWVDHAPFGTRIEFKASKRTLPQNDLMWALLTDVAQQKEHGGRKYPPEDWKAIFLHALGQEMRFIPSLDGKTFLPLGNRSSDLSKPEMTDLIELILAWGTENGVTFHDDQRAA